jgi:hypothetical protein
LRFRSPQLAFCFFVLTFFCFFFLFWGVPAYSICLIPVASRPDEERVAHDCLYRDWTVTLVVAILAIYQQQDLLHFSGKAGVRKVSSLQYT